MLFAKPLCFCCKWKDGGKKQINYAAQHFGFSKIYYFVCRDKKRTSVWCFDVNNWFVYGWQLRHFDESFLCGICYQYVGCGLIINTVWPIKVCNDCEKCIYQILKVQGQLHY